MKIKHVREAYDSVAGKELTRFHPSSPYTSWQAQLYDSFFIISDCLSVYFKVPTFLILKIYKLRTPNFFLRPQNPRQSILEPALERG